MCVYIYRHIGDISYVHGFWDESTKNRPRKHFQASQAAEPDVVPGLGSQGAAHKWWQGGFNPVQWYNPSEISEIFVTG